MSSEKYSEPEDTYNASLEAPSVNIVTKHSKFKQDGSTDHIVITQEEDEYSFEQEDTGKEPVGQGLQRNESTDKYSEIQDQVTGEVQEPVPDKVVEQNINIKESENGEDEYNEPRDEPVEDEDPIEQVDEPLSEKPKEPV